MTKKAVHISLIIFFICSFTAICNDSSLFRNIGIETQLHYGFIIPHHSSIEYFLEDHLQGIEIDLYKKTNGSNLWQQLYRFPLIGVGYFYSNLGNDNVYGYAHALYGYMDIPLLPHTKWFSLNYKLGFGLAYLTKKFDLEDDYYNQAIGSHVNVCVKLVGDMRFKLSKRLGLVNSFGLTHFSNGKIKTPNLGLNLFTVSIGFNYLLTPDNRIIIPSEIPKWKKHFEYSTFLNAGVKSDGSFVPHNYLISSFCFDAAWRFSYKYKTGLGVDFMYDASIRYELEKEGDTSISTLDLTRTGIHWLYDIYYRNLIMTIQVGYTIYSAYQQETSVYNRLGLRYKFSKHFIVNLSLISHFAKADFVEWGIGYTW